jgi:tRNA A-37 threonylcarbamoyl transferase component Bud32
MASDSTTFEGFRWVFAAEVPDATRQRLTAGHWGTDAVVLKRNRRRTIYRLPGTPGAIIKHDRPPRLRDRLKGLWRNPGLREYEATVLARNRGLPVAPPIGFARRGGETLYAAMELKACGKLRDVWDGTRSDSAARARLLAGLAVFARQFAAAQVVHPDLHAGNILVRQGPAEAECFLVDLAGARAVAAEGRLTAWECAGWVTQLAPAINRPEALRLLAAARVAVRDGSGAAVWLDLLRRCGREAARRWPGRRERLLTSSSLCDVAPVEAGLWRLYRPFSLEQAQEALRQHEANVAADRMLKVDRKRRLSRVTVHGQALVVKEFLAPGRGPWRADRRSWFNHYRLSAAHFPVCRCHAWLQGPSRGILVLEDVGQQNLQQACRTAGPAERRSLLKAAMRLLAGLHAAGTVPRDMKATNLVVAPGGDPARAVCLVDVDAVRFDAQVRPGDRLGNLLQFSDNLPPEVRPRERLRAAVVYRRESGLCHEGLRRLLRDRRRGPGGGGRLGVPRPG